MRERVIQDERRYEPIGVGSQEQGEEETRAAWRPEGDRTPGGPVRDSDECDLPVGVEGETSRDFILDPSRWPDWPRLRLRRYADPGGAESGYLQWGSRTEPPTDQEPWTLKRGSADGPTGEGDLLHYASVDELLDDGWVVDRSNGRSRPGGSR